MKRLLIIGAGGHGQVIKEVAQDINVYDQIDFLDDYNKNAIGKINDLSKFSTNIDVFCGIGNNEIRQTILTQVKQMGFNIPTLIHPTAYISPSTKIEVGVVVEPKAIVNANTVIKEGTIVSIGAIIDHDAIIEEYVHVNTGSICKAGSKVKAKTKLEAGEVIKGY